MRNHISVVFCTALLALLTGCSYVQLKNEAPQVNEISANTKFTIILPEDHSTGYIWQLKPDFDGSVVRQINEVWHGNEKGIYFHLTSLSSGQTTLTFISRKYTDTAAVKHFIVKIKED